MTFQFDCQDIAKLSVFWQRNSQDTAKLQKRKRKKEEGEKYVVIFQQCWVFAAEVSLNALLTSEYLLVKNWQTRNIKLQLMFRKRLSPWCTSVIFLTRGRKCIFNSIPVKCCFLVDIARYAHSSFFLSTLHLKHINITGITIIFSYFMCWFPMFM